MSRFWTLMTDEFGAAYADTLARGHVVHALGDRTAAAALAEGMSPRTVWESLCEDLDIPEHRRLGIDRAPMPVPPRIANEPSE
ncbi:DUF3046 domain-containing protein [Janibacter cremeus]|uniref:DUF3046 domain-containing protein n=1 Tax=Janibacter cremeus TaxID=1285192 RepID=A0A852VQQ1_9MICO|nr:hypothetical protein [Janibacter cremeus]